MPIQRCKKQRDMHPMHAEPCLTYRADTAGSPIPAAHHTAAAQLLWHTAPWGGSHRLHHHSGGCTSGSDPPATPEQHICQEIWCQYLPGALQSQLHKLSLAALRPFPLLPTYTSMENTLLEWVCFSAFLSSSQKVLQHKACISPTESPAPHSVIAPHKMCCLGEKKARKRNQSSPHSHKAWVPM